MVKERSQQIKDQLRIEEEMAKSKSLVRNAPSPPSDDPPCDDPPMDDPPSNTASAAASTDSPHAVNQLSTNLTKQSRQHLVFNIIQKSSACKDWKNLGRELGVENSAIDSITLDNANNVQEQCYQMLLRWHQTQPASRAIPDVLIKALESIDCKSVADQINECVIDHPFTQDPK